MQKKESPLSDEILCGEYKSVFRYVMSLCKNETEAEDITQEAFLRAIRHSGSFSQGSSLYTWLCTIARNVWLNRCKISGREITSDISDEDIQSGEFPLSSLSPKKTLPFISIRLFTD